jgi:hypothetical protein
MPFFRDRTTLSSIEGQWRAPIPVILPLYNGERSRDLDNGVCFAVCIGYKAGVGIRYPFGAV